MRVLVTGSSGMIGSALVEALQHAGFAVIGLDAREPAFYTALDFVCHDLRLPVSGDAEQRLTEEPIDLIIHLAANARVYQLVVEPDRALDNILMTHHIFEFARRHGVPKILFASSRETYGNGNTLPVHESVASHRSAESSYTASKIAGEAYCYAYSHCYDIDARVIRYSNVYGRYDMSDRFVPKAILHLMQGKPFAIYGEGKTLDFTYLDDAVGGTIALIQAWNEGLPHREYNIASGNQATLYDVALMLKELLNSPSTISIAQNLVGEVMNYQADVSRMREIGWQPTTPLNDGLARALTYYTEVYRDHMDPDSETKS